MKTALRSILAGLVTLALGIALGVLAQPPRIAHAASPGKAPAAAIDALLALRLPDATGKEQAMAQWRGKIVVVNFWATWCPPCREEIPDFAVVSQAFASAPVQFVGISVDAASKVRAFNDKYQIPYPLLVAGNDILGLAAELGNTARALPFTVIIDRDGKLSHTQLGILHRAELERKIRALLAQ